MEPKIQVLWHESNVTRFMGMRMLPDLQPWLGETVRGLESDCGIVTAQAVTIDSKCSTTGKGS